MSTFSTADHQQETERIKKYNFVSTVSHKIDAKDENRYHLEEFFTQLPGLNGGILSGNTIFSAEVVIPADGTLNAFTVTQPANTVLIDVGLVVIDAFTTGGGNTGFKVGISAGSSEICSVSDAINNDASEVVLGAVCSVGNSGLPNAGTTTLSFQDAAVLFTTSERTIHGTMDPNAGVSEAGKARMFIKFASIDSTTTYDKNKNFEVVGTNSSGGTIAYDRVAPGVKLTTLNTINDSMIIAPHLDSNQSAWTGAKWNTGYELIWECAVQLPSVAENVFWAGLKQTNVDTINTDASSAFFRSNGSSLEFIYSNGNAGSNDDKYTTNLGITLTVNKTYRLKIVIDSNRFVSVFVNGTQYGLTTTTGVTGVTQSITNKKSLQLLPADLIPYIGIKTSAAEAKDLVVCYEKISRALKDN